MASNLAHTAVKNMACSSSRSPLLTLGKSETLVQVGQVLNILDPFFILQKVYYAKINNEINKEINKEIKPGHNFNILWFQSEIPGVLRMKSI